MVFLTPLPLPLTLEARLRGVPAVLLGLELPALSDFMMLKWPAVLAPLESVRILVRRSRIARGVGLSKFSAVNAMIS